MLIIRREKYNHRYRIVAREDGKLAAWKYVKGFSLQKARDIYRKNNSFNENLERRVTKLARVNEYEYLTRVDAIPPVGAKDAKEYIRSRKPTKKEFGFALKLKDEKKSAQYIVHAFMKDGKEIIARSRSLFLEGNRQLQRADARDEAYSNLFLKISELYNKGYDEDEGVKLIPKIAAIKEGWIFYKGR
jgi:hypothetical protein